MRIIALIAAYNEERFIAACLEHLRRHGLEAYLIDNESTDRTVAIAERFRGRGLAGIETMPRRGTHALQAKLERKQELAAALDADWFMHMDPDEIRLPPRASTALARALERADGEGYNAVNFLEHVFIPTREAPNHDHPHFQKTMRWYYPFGAYVPDLIRAWRKQPCPVELAWAAGHQVRFPGRRVYPDSFPMRHYQFLSVPHAIRKYMFKSYDPAEVRLGWHGWRAGFRPERLALPPQAALREYVSDDLLDTSSPRTRHHFFSEEWERLEVKQRSRVARITDAPGLQLLSRYGRIRNRYLLPVYRRLQQARRHYFPP